MQIIVTVMVDGKQHMHRAWTTPEVVTHTVATRAGVAIAGDVHGVVRDALRPLEVPVPPKEAVA
jgi:hypothetical protein